MNDCISGDYDSPDAPWNQKDPPVCPTCNNFLTLEDSGENWEEWKCEECGFWYSTEPDWDDYD
jgi:tRNA(Ile2) C34 agmatinyltransferase TiaS